MKCEHQNWWKRCYTEAKTGGGKPHSCHWRAHTLGAWMKMAREKILSRKEVTAMAGCGTVQNLHMEGHEGRYCLRAGIADRQRAVGSLLSWNFTERNVAFTELGTITDFLIWSQDIKENGKDEPRQALTLNGGPASGKKLFSLWVWK